MDVCLQSALVEGLESLLQAIPNLSGANSIISNHLFDSTFDEKEQSVLEKILIPSESEAGSDITSSFAIFIGFDFHWSEEIFYKNALEFNTLFQHELLDKIQSILSNLKDLLERFDIVNSELNCYLVPFSNTSNFCQSFIEEL